MCGVVGFFERRMNPEASVSVARNMVRSVAHRGPDDRGVWTDPEAGIALGHSRLSIMDLSSEGHQPMLRAGRRYVISYNGEIYNFLEIRRVLEDLGYSFRGHSDTEVMLASIEEWGLKAAVQRFAGMFAFALWDQKERTLSLVRDRVGIKPMYYGWSGGSFLFGSELKAIKVHPAFREEIDRDVLALFLRHNYVPSPLCIYRGYYKLVPGTILTIKSPETHVTPDVFWSAKSVAEEGADRVFDGSVEDATDQLEELLQQAIKEHMISDAPLGAFLSGGIDSSMTVAMMQSQSERRVKTFSIGFREQEFNEAEHAKNVARHLGTDHTELYVSSQECVEVIPKLPFIYDEPFADPSQVPTYLLSELTQNHVKVSLSGDGGDELFCGYRRYFSAQHLWEQTHRLPTILHPWLIRGGKSALVEKHGIWFDRIGRTIPGMSRGSNLSHKLRRLAHYLSLDSPGSMYPEQVSYWNGAHNDLVIDGCAPETTLTDPAKWATVTDFMHHMMFIDSVTYLPDDILTKVDRASMAVSLETRVPLLDHRVVEFASRLPLAMKVRFGESKWILRKVLERYVPSELWDRPKTGFGMPIGLWLQGPLREWAEELLSKSRLRQEGYLRPEPVRQKWEQHLKTGQGLGYDLWGVLMFQAWKESQTT